MAVEREKRLADYGLHSERVMWRGKGPGKFEEELGDLERRLGITTLAKAVRWAQTKSMWPDTFGLACCAIEMMSIVSARYDIARFGMEPFRGSPRQAELSEPEAREASSRDVPEQDERVPAAHEPEEGGQRPEDEPERPALEVRHRTRLRAEAVRIDPRRPSMLELVADEPEVVGGLEVVAWGGLAVAGSSACEEARARVVHRRPGRRDSRREVEGAGERYIARAAASSVSKSGTSELS